MVLNKGGKNVCLEFRGFNDTAFSVLVPVDNFKSTIVVIMA